MIADITLVFPVQHPRTVHLTPLIVRDSLHVTPPWGGRRSFLRSHSDLGSLEIEKVKVIFEPLPISMLYTMGFVKACPGSSASPRTWDEPHWCLEKSLWVSAMAHGNKWPWIKCHCSFNPLSSLLIMSEVRFVWCMSVFNTCLLTFACLFLLKEKGEANLRFRAFCRQLYAGRAK